MINFFKNKIKQKKLEASKRKRLEQEKRRAVEKAANDIIAHYKELMLSKPCPINNNENCFDSCVHFRDGYVYRHILIGPGKTIVEYRHKSPKCSLWAISRLNLNNI